MQAGGTLGHAHRRSASVLNSRAMVVAVTRRQRHRPASRERLDHASNSDQRSAALHFMNDGASCARSFA
jgi:hypothetical protein